MGIIGEAFGRLFEVIINGLTWIGQQIGRFFSWLGGLIWDAITWLGELLMSLFEALLDVLLWFFDLVIQFIDGVLYFLFQIGLLVAKVFLLFWELALLLFSFVVGFGRTLASLRFSGGGGSNGYSDMIGQVFNALEPLQLNVVAYILLTIIWVFTAINVIKLISNLRVGGD